jgi:hypothetical protein
MKRSFIAFGRVPDSEITGSNQKERNESYNSALKIIHNQMMNILCSSPDPQVRATTVILNNSYFTMEGVREKVTRALWELIQDETIIIRNDLPLEDFYTRPYKKNQLKSLRKTRSQKKNETASPAS